MERKKEKLWGEGLMGRGKGKGKEKEEEEDPYVADE